VYCAGAGVTCGGGDTVESKGAWQDEKGDLPQRVGHPASGWVLDFGERKNGVVARLSKAIINVPRQRSDRKYQQAEFIKPVGG